MRIKFISKLAIHFFSGGPRAARQFLVGLRPRKVVSKLHFFLSRPDIDESLCWIMTLSSALLLLPSPLLFFYRDTDPARVAADDVKLRTKARFRPFFVRLSPRLLSSGRHFKRDGLNLKLDGSCLPRSFGWFLSFPLLLFDSLIDFPLFFLRSPDKMFLR